MLGIDGQTSAGVCFSYVKRLCALAANYLKYRTPYHSWRPTLVAQWARTSCSTAALIHAFFPGSSLPPRSEGTRWSGQLWRRGAAHMPARACWCPGLPHGCPPPMTSSIIVVGRSAAQIVDGVIQNGSPIKFNCKNISAWPNFFLN